MQKAISATLYTDGKTPSCASSVRHDQKAVFPVRRKKSVSTNCSHTNHSGFFWWKLLVNQKYSDPCRCFGKLTEEGWGWGKNLHLGGNSTKLAWCFATPRALPICHTQHSEFACLCNTTFRVLSWLTAFRSTGTHNVFGWPQACTLGLFTPKHGAFNEISWSFTFQSISKYIKKCSTVSAQIPMLSRRLLFHCPSLGIIKWPQSTYCMLYW